MFTSKELQLIAGMCQDENWLLRHMEQKGIVTVSAQTEVSSLRLKALELAAAIQKQEAAKEAAEKAKE